MYNNHLRCDAAQPLPGAAAAVELGHDHGVADRHQQDRDEEHDDVHEEVVDLLGDLDVDHVVGLQVALQPGGEDLVAGPLVPDHAPGLVLNRVRIELSNRTLHLQRLSQNLLRLCQLGIQTRSKVKLGRLFIK